MLALVFIRLRGVLSVFTVSSAFIVIHWDIFPLIFYRYIGMVLSLLSLYVFWILTWLVCACWNVLASLASNEIEFFLSIHQREFLFSVHWCNLTITFCFIHIFWSFDLYPDNASFVWWLYYIPLFLSSAVFSLQDYCGIFWRNLWIQWHICSVLRQCLKKHWGVGC